MYRRSVGHQALSWPHESERFREFANDKLVPRLLPFNGINSHSIVVMGKQFLYLRDANMNQLELNGMFFAIGLQQNYCLKLFFERFKITIFFLPKVDFHCRVTFTCVWT